HFKDAPPNPDYPMSPEMSDKVMHASFTIGDSMIMCSDGDCSQPAGAAHAGYSLSLNPATVEEGQKLFDALADGGEVTMPFGKTFWALGFGMAKDRFGVHWMVVEHFARDRLCELHARGWPRRVRVDAVWSRNRPLGPAGSWLLDAMLAA
ncbi:VOC family protein, partial [Burkholderia sola]|uniref:VOC family protein n=1 Tax=Burkholderia sola TaxID=2843302 RepID=UPI0023DDE61C